MQSSDPLAKIDKLIQGMNEFEQYKDVNILEIALDFSDLIGKMNADRIGETRKYVSGSFITPEYAASTQKRKGYKNPDLYETGEFLSVKSFALSMQGGIYSPYINIYNKDDKYEAGVLSKYEKGGELFGLTEEDELILAEQVKPILINKFVKFVLG